MYVRVNIPVSAPENGSGKRTGVGPQVLQCSYPLLLVFVYRIGQMQRINFPKGINKVLFNTVLRLENNCSYSF